MAERIGIGQVVQAYGEYAALAGRLGFELKKGALRQHALAGLAYRGDMKSFFSASYARQFPGRSAPAQVFRAVAELRDDLAGAVRRRLNGQLKAEQGECLGAILKALEGCPPELLSGLAGEVAGGRHAAFLKCREVPVAELQAALKGYAGDQSVARSKLVEHICRQLQGRGRAMSAASVEERLRRNTKVQHVPQAMLDVVRQLDSSFRSGLVPIETMTGEEDPTAWLERARLALAFRSKNALHKWLAQTTGVHYETVHKALTNPHPGQRLRIELRDGLLAWLEKSKSGAGPLPLPRDEGAAPIIRPILRQLAGCYPSLGAMCREAAVPLGISSSSVRKIYEGGPNGRVSDEGIAALRRLLETRAKRPAPASYLRDRAVRKTVFKLAQKAERVREQWQVNQDERLHGAFKRLRLKMIVALKEGLVVLPDRPADQSPEPDCAEAF